MPQLCPHVLIVAWDGVRDDERRAARERVRFYKDRGYAVKFIDLAEYR